jgi:hypothetical protein
LIDGAVGSQLRCLEGVGKLGVDKADFIVTAEAIPVSPVTEELICPDQELAFIVRQFYGSNCCWGRQGKAVIARRLARGGTAICEKVSSPLR